MFMKMFSALINIRFAMGRSTYFFHQFFSSNPFILCRNWVNMTFYTIEGKKHVIQKMPLISSRSFDEQMVRQMKLSSALGNSLNGLYLHFYKNGTANSASKIWKSNHQFNCEGVFQCFFQNQFIYLYETFTHHDSFERLENRPNRDGRSFAESRVNQEIAVLDQHPQLNESKKVGREKKQRTCDETVVEMYALVGGQKGNAFQEYSHLIL